MKSLFFTAAILLSATVFAQNEKLSGLREFNIVKSDFAASHAAETGDGSLTIDFTKSSVKLFVTRKHTCPPNMMCAQFMPAPLIVELPITSLKTDSCGIHTIVAREDKRPVDGSLSVMTIKDATDMTCKTLVAVANEASYQTSYVDRVKGKDVTATSKMILQLKTQDTKTEEAAVLLKYEQNSGFSPRPGTRTILVYTNGKVVFESVSFMDNKKESVVLATLSTKAIATLKKQILTIDPKAELTDEDKDAPKCTDAPSSAVYVTLANQEVQISGSESCHTFKMYSGDALNLAYFVQGFSYIAR